ncbi:peptide chain release factor 1, mitochondrial isoform X2 [Hippocampus zosterae]|uniref:peptide chain release factor 1, mitochondrial isoform X2 n=1 Tax=Hippocampus zosterae TaxID=109293 RepID=UPI00223D91BD|nr:peptide chain release factor 1, mitochondrial isoform X2 [Hippocampus zosterae]
MFVLKFYSNRHRRCFYFTHRFHVRRKLHRQMLSRSLCRLRAVFSCVVYNNLNRGWWRTSSGYTGEKHAIALAQRCITLTTRSLLHNDLGCLYENDSVQMYLRQLMDNHKALEHKLQRSNLSEAHRKVMVKKYTDLLPLAHVYYKVEQALKDLDEINTILHSGSKDEDEQFDQLLKEEEVLIAERISVLKKELIKALLPIDPLDSSNILLEVVSGRTTGGGLHHAAVRIAGENVYRHLKHEGGTHRVQRIPEVGLSSRMQRIHTGTMTVVVLPQPVEVDVSIDPKELRVDTFRSRGAGGQSVNTTDSAVRIVHLPSGITAECQQTRSQLQNRETAMRMLKARLYQSMMSKETEQKNLARKQQVGTRSQSERIRTYNFSQDRVTDHRIGYICRGIKEFMRGGEALDDVITVVLEHAEREALLDLVENSRSSVHSSAD